MEPEDTNEEIEVEDEDAETPPIPRAWDPWEWARLVRPAENHVSVG